MFKYIYTTVLILKNKERNLIAPLGKKKNYEPRWGKKKLLDNKIQPLRIESKYRI